jgi:stage II sporulation protein D
MATFAMVGSRALATALIAVGVLVAASAAGAEPMLVIDGAGEGHGVGMSQIGAEGLATHGDTYQQILAHYYTGTAVTTLPTSQTVSVLLQAGRSSITFSEATYAATRRLGFATTYRAIPFADGQIELESSHGRALATLASPVTITGPSPIRLGGTALNGIFSGIYHGSFELIWRNDHIDVLDIVGLESYVRGVVPAESPPSWATAELEAQAVASRTYAITTHESTEFDLFANTQSQQYDGVHAETLATNAAVTATAGQVVTYDGTPAVTYFFASSGGETEDIADAFLGAAPEPWLTSVPDPYDSTRFGPLSFTLADAQQRLGTLLEGTLEAINVTQRGASPRVVSAQLIGSAGTTVVSGPQLEAAFGLPSTWACFDVTDASGVPPSGWDAACATPAQPPAEGASGASGSTGATGAT